ncbi:MAG: hypothetical protein Q4D81_07720 [Eubacteriales bacterium]|nr:hypothetical protein [Eubacteriales bacterium]
MEERAITRLMRDDEGVYHWVYRLPMFKNFSILKTVLKAMGIGLLITYALILLLVTDGGTNRPDGLGMLIGILALVFVAVVIIAFACYFGVAALYGGYYVAVYNMDDRKISMLQPADQADRNKLIAMFSAAAGALGGNWGLVAASTGITGTLVAESEFSKIRSLKIIPGLGEIRVHAFLTWYTVYVNPEDFGLVAEYMESRSINAKVVHK